MNEDSSSPGFPAGKKLSVILNAGITSQYLPEMPYGLGVPKRIIAGAWPVVGFCFALKMDAHEHDPALYTAGLGDETGARLQIASRTTFRSPIRPGPT